MQKLDELFEIVKENGIVDMCSEEAATVFDKQDELSHFRDEFLFPKPENQTELIYLCGNSLGIQPKGLKKYINTQLDKWANEGVEGHFSGDTPWLDIDETVSNSMSKLVGALPSEVVVMNSLTCNLHLMMISFYRPTETRFKILIEKKAFPSDYHVVISQLQLHGFDPDSSLLEISPREGEICLRQEDIEDFIRKEGSSIALVLFSGVQYYTGQFFDILKITQVSHSMGCKVGFDLAHAVGNVPLNLHEWGCDFACWCTYKYMNCGPGCLGGCFVHERHGGKNMESHQTQEEASSEHSLSSTMDPIRLAGWWGHRREDRFLMAPNFIPCEGANGFRLSNPPVLLVSCIRASLDLFDQAGIDKLRNKSILLTGYLEYLIKTKLPTSIKIFTPSDPAQRGCQLSLCCVNVGKIDTGVGYLDSALEKLKDNGVICDARKPDVLRIAPTPLYNSFMDVLKFVNILKSILD